MSVIESGQQEIADRLATIAILAQTTIITESLGDIQNQVARALGTVNADGGLVGAIVIITTPTANVNWENVAGPFFDDIPVEILVAVNPTINNDPAAGTNNSALTICEAICASLHQFFPLSFNGPLVAVRPTITRGPNLGDDESIITYKIAFRGMGGIRTALPQVALPGSSVNVATYTFTCATAGAAIFFTSDGSNPMPLNGRLYTAPIAPGSGLTIKVRAWLAGYLASETLTFNT